MLPTNICKILSKHLTFLHNILKTYGKHLPEMFYYNNLTLFQKCYQNIMCLLGENL